MFFVIPLSVGLSKVRAPIVSITIAVLCCLAFVQTNVFERDGGVRADDEAAIDAWVEAHPEEVAAENAIDTNPELRRLVITAQDHAGGTLRAMALVPARGVAQIGWLTSLFIHFGFVHLFFNLLFLYLVGPLLEDAWGRVRFAVFYLVGGVLAGAAQFALDPHSVSSIGGASGAIAACMGAFAIRFAATRVRLGTSSGSSECSWARCRCPRGRAAWCGFCSSSKTSQTRPTAASRLARTWAAFSSVARWR